MSIQITLGNEQFTIENETRKATTLIDFFEILSRYQSTDLQPIKKDALHAVGFISVNFPERLRSYQYKGSGDGERYRTLHWTFQSVLSLSILPHTCYYSTLAGVALATLTGELWWWAWRVGVAERLKCTSIRNDSWTPKMPLRNWESKEH